MSASALLLLLVPLWPALLGLVTLACSRRSLGAPLSVLGILPALGVASYPAAFHGADYPWLLFGARLGLDQVDAVFLLFTAVVWLLAAAFAYGWFEREQGRQRFFGLFLLTMSGNVGSLVAQDLASFYAFFALMSFAAYGLIAHERSREARHAANVYVVLVVIGEAALAAALILAVGSVGAGDFVAVRGGLETAPLSQLIIVLTFTGFGIKAGVLILHVWLPLAHPVAPAPASAVLSGTIIVTGLVGWLRMLPIGEWALPGWGGACIGLGLAAAFYGAFVGIDQRRPKVVLAYSSVSQVGIMTVGIGMMLAEPSLAQTLRTAIAFFALHHGLAKCALFLGAGLGNTVMDAARRRRLVIGLALPALALAGAPFTSGMVVKATFVAGEEFLPGPWASAMRWLLPLTSVATALLMGRFLALVHSGSGHARHVAPRGSWWSWGASLLLVLLLPWWLAPQVGFSWTAPSFAGSLWPLGVAVGVALVAIRAWRRAGRPALPEIPAGDVLLPMERLVLVLRHAYGATTALLQPLVEGARRGAATVRGRAWLLIQSTGSAETLLNRWPVAVALALLVGVVLALLAR